MDNFNLTNHFLIAMPTLEDPNFARTVTFICLHNDDGALGIVINRPLAVNLAEVFEQMDINCTAPATNAQEIYEGGPVNRDRGFILHRPVGEWASSIQVTPQIAVSTSRDILQAIGVGEGPVDSLVALGYAGWGAGQLEFEMSENAWLSGPAHEEIIFEVPANERWRLAAAAMGVDIDVLSGDIGHA
ncbi:MAG: YqgE/AlgH family protein [Gammaproteobacteria bacterium]